jgi:hypothetical protein
VRFYGNKMPGYYFRLGALLRENPALKLFYIYRSPKNTVYSWDSRAARPRDTWPSGRRGAFGVIEQIFCLKRLAALDAPVVAVSYDALLFDDRTLMGQMLDFVGADVRRFDQAGFEAQLFNQASRKNIDSEPYAELFRRFRFDEIDRFLKENKVVLTTNNEFRTVVGDQFGSVPEPHEFVEWLQRFDPAALDYLGRWREIVVKRLDNTTEDACAWIDAYTEQACLVARDRGVAGESVLTA